jgi:hypothetical protein
MRLSNEGASVDRKRWPSRPRGSGGVSRKRRAKSNIRVQSPAGRTTMTMSLACCRCFVAAMGILMVIAAAQRNPDGSPDPTASVVDEQMS